MQGKTENKETKNYNSMCLNCLHLNNSCPGTKSDVWTGCILKDRPEAEAKEYIDHMTEIIERQEHNKM